MSDRIRFHLDENADPRIARALRRMDIDAISTVEAGIRTVYDRSGLRCVIATTALHT
jgi:hypothetical protein